MLAAIVLRARSGVELGLVFLSVALSIVAALRARRGPPEERLVALVGAYFGALGGVALGAHALSNGAPLVLGPYAVTLAAGVLASWGFILPRLVRLGFPIALVAAVLLGCLVCGVVGSRVTNTLADLLDHGANPEDLVDRRAGLGVFGAFAFDACFLALLFRRFPGQSLGALLDASASVTAFNLAVGRLGCLLGGCCYGAPAAPSPFTLPVRAFDPASPAGVAYLATPDVHIWATQPLEALLVLGIAAGAERAYRAKAARGWQDGAVLAGASAAYGAVRAGMETLRADSPRLVLGALTLWQVLSVALCAGSLAWLAWRGRAGGIASTMRV